MSVYRAFRWSLLVVALVAGYSIGADIRAAAERTHAVPRDVTGLFP